MEMQGMVPIGDPKSIPAIMEGMASLTDPGALKPFLARHGIAARKGLGQHFLCSAKVVGAIVARVEGMAGVLEIGPGPGILTVPLANQTQRIIALEIDPRMIGALAESAPNADIRLLDALQTPLAAILAELPSPRAVVSNLPYYITGPLLDRIAAASGDWSRAVLMMQREVGRKLLAPPGDSDRGALSVALQASFDIERVCDVPPGAFLPPPKVESIVLQLTPKAVALPPGLLDFVRAGFRQPRKTLVNNLAQAGVQREKATAALQMAHLDERVRPHALTLDEWARLHHLLGVS